MGDVGFGVLGISAWDKECGRFFLGSIGLSVLMESQGFLGGGEIFCGWVRTSPHIPLGVSLLRLFPLNGFLSVAETNIGKH